MPRFRYTAVLDSGQRVQGTLKGQGRAEAVRQLLGRGCHPVEIEPADGASLGALRITRDRFRRVGSGELAIFTRQLASLLRAGMPMVQALATVRRQGSNRLLVAAVGDIEEALSREGGNLADCLEEHPRIFGAVYRGLVRAGEEGGNLVEVLEGLADHLARSAKMRGQVVGAFIYPIFLVLVGTAAIFVLMAFVLPRFQEMFKGLGQQLPAATKALMAFSGFLATNWWAVLAGIVGSALILTALLRRPAVREALDRRLLRLPVLGKMWLKLEVARISRTLAALLGNGVKMLDALAVTGQTARNLAIRRTFPAIIKGVAGGRDLSAMTEEAGVFPSLMHSLLRTGEETGELPEMLSQLAEIYEAEADRAVAGAVRLLEPMLILLLGGAVAVIVAAVMLPIFNATAMVR